MSPFNFSPGWNGPFPGGDRKGTRPYVDVPRVASFSCSCSRRFATRRSFDVFMLETSKVAPVYSYIERSNVDEGASVAKVHSTLEVSRGLGGVLLFPSSPVV